MRYDLHNQLRRKNFSLAVKKAWENDELVEFKVIKTRSLDQNAYLHVCLAYLAREYGESLEYVKQVLYKQMWNKEIFYREKFDEKLATNTAMWRSSADLTVEEMKKSIDNLRNGALKDMDIYIPDAHEEELVHQMMREIR